MILEVDHWYQGYGQILEDCRGRGADGYALILVHADVDAMAAARILTYMLRADQVPYQLQPCPTHTALEHCVRNYGTTSGSGNPPAALVLLNVGGTRNLSKLFGPDKLSVDQTKVYVMDGRRPVHLANVYAAQHLVVFWDPTHGDLDELPSDGDNLSGNEEEEEEDSSSSSEDEDESESEDESDDEDEMEMEFDDEQAQVKSLQDKTDVDVDADIDYDGEDERDPAEASPRKPKKKTKRSKRSDSDGHDTDSTQELEEDEEEDMAATPPTATATTAASSTQETTQEQTLPSLTPAELYRQRLVRLRQYYVHGSSHGTPSSFVAWNLATSLRFGNSADLLWLAMVGVTDAYLQARLDVHGYAQVARILQDTSVKLFPPDHDVCQRVDDTVYAEDLYSNNNNNNNNSNARTKITFSEQGRILAQTDYKFFLLRQSSLYDSMVCSPYVSTQLQLWTKPGMQRLQELLARMGYPLDQCQQPFWFMKPSLRRRLTDQMAQYKEEFGLDELEFTSFFRVTGYSNLTSASDTAYAVTALLECPIRTGTGTTNDGPTSTSSDWDMDCFHAAYDALGPTSDQQKQKLKLGTVFAKNLQKYILQTANGLVTRDAITRLKHFRYAYVSCTNGTEANSTSSSMMQQRASSNPQDINDNDDSAQYHVLAKPLALTRLALYLMDMHRSNGKWVGDAKKVKPLILLAEQPIGHKYLVVGMEMADEPGQLPKNKLGQHFALVAQTLTNTTSHNNAPMGAPVTAAARLESFDAHVVEVSATHAQRFLEQLHYLMDQA